MVSTRQSFFLIKQYVEQVPSNRLIDKIRYTNNKDTVAALDVHKDFKEITRLSNQFSMVFKESLGVGTKMSISESAIRDVLKVLLPTINVTVVEQIDDYQWNKETTTSIISVFKEMVRSYTHIISLPPKTCADVELYIKEENTIKATSLARADVSGHTMSVSSGKEEIYNSEKVKASLEELTNGLNIVEYANSQRVVAKIDSEISFTHYKLGLNVTLVEYCSESTNQDNYVMLYRKNKGFITMNSALDESGLIKIGSASEWCNIYSLKVGDFNKDGISDLLCHLDDGTNKIMISDKERFISISNSSNNGNIGVN